jgi:hypothetical protein
MQKQSRYTEQEATWASRAAGVSALPVSVCALQRPLCPDALCPPDGLPRTVIHLCNAHWFS